MFKRITKKQKKNELDEELGLDEEAKQVFGMQDTDSDESNSDSDSNSDLDSDLNEDSRNIGDELDDGSDAELKMEWLAAEGGGSEDEDDADEEGLALDEELELDDEPPMPLNEAVKNPVYLISMNPDVRACIVCPKKLLKNSKMVELHVESAAHVRRFKRFCELAETRKNESKDPRRVAAVISQKPKAAITAKSISKRGLKRKAKLESIRKKREVAKLIIERKKKEARAAKSADASAASGPESDKAASERPQKRRKVSKEKDTHKDGGVKKVDAGDQPAMAKSSKTKTKAKAKVKAKANVDMEVDKVEAAGAGSKPKGKVKVSMANVKVSEDVATISSDRKAPLVKKSKTLKSKGEAHARKMEASKGTTPSDTRRHPRDKSKRKAPEGKSADCDALSRQSARYFDGAEDGTRPKEVGPTKASAKKSKSRTKESKSTRKDDREKRAEKMQNERKRKATDDLVIFD